MADTNSNVWGYQNPTGNQLTSFDGGLVGANLTVATVTVTVGGSETASDNFNLLDNIPKGMVPIPALSRVAVVSDPGTALEGTIKSQDKNGNETAQSWSAADITLSAVGNIDAGYATCNEFGDVSKVWFDIATATSLTADASIVFYLVFRKAY